MGDPGEQGAEVEGLAPPLRRIPIEDAFSGLLGVVREVGTAARTHWPGLLDRPIRALGDAGRKGPLGSASLWALRQLGRRGSVAAQRELGYRLANGTGAPLDPVEGFQWFRRGAQAGDAACQYALGVLYAAGHGVAEAKLSAALWYHKAAEQGHSMAQFNLALLYDAGDGVARDSEKALMWYRRAAEQEYPRALFNLGVRLEQGVDGTADFDRMTAYYRRAAEQGFGPAQLRLAQADLEQGRAADAWFWFSVAGQTLTAEEDQAQARAGCDAAYHQMTLAEIEAARHRLRDWSIAP